MDGALTRRSDGIARQTPATESIELAEISNATSEQSSGIGNVNTSVAELDQMTQQNSALVEQACANRLSNSSTPWRHSD